MAIRNKRQTNLLKDTSTGTVNISHGSSSKPQNTGFFGSSFTNTGSSSRKRRRRRLHARAQQAARAIAEAEAIAQAERQAQEHAQSLARAQHEREERVKAEETARAHAEAVARAQAEKEQVYRHTINLLTDSFRIESQDIARHYTTKSASLSESIAQEVGLVDSQRAPHTGQQALDLILQEKAQINYLIAMKSADRNAINNALTASGTGVGNPDSGQYKHFLETHSNGDANLSHQLHRRWIDAYTQTQQSQLLSQAIALLEERSTQLSTQHAELSYTFRTAKEIEESVSAKQANTLWKAVAPPALSATTAGIDTVQTRAAQLAKEYFVRIASKAFTRNAGLALAAYAPTLGDAERPSPVVGTPLSQLNLPETLDLAYVASVGGAIDVPHRLVESINGERTLAQWTATDGVKLGTKVRVRTFTYNAQNNTYEFIRDGESTPALIWTPIARPADSSTVSPVNPPALPADPGSTVSPVAPELETYPAIDRNDPDDYILVSPIDSGLPDTYLLFKDPRSIPGVASGYGESIVGIWLGEKTRADGASIPSHIADQLRGKRFAHFDLLRKAIWTAIANDSELSKQLSQHNLNAMRDGGSPYPRLVDQVGGRTKFEIHHKNHVANGGAVYDFDNLVIMTPKQHIDHHRSKKNDL
ncbi:S-type pyocin domain-containing protein [Pseudomonas sp. CDFA 602]|uniref:S-type pyocin domain-containing protein n=1 Tax=Pseudomonas californiensis TaxID=2829823 RepID=UPI001E4ADBF5|nr:S-type pyocin domain-containing protein [Pseudomonas californiensis]MCD5992062.1 S-type pyocin domain-containing protein [Pseudomonas californiensis]MCD5997670.1 S-type pyocin domain-containing protein [Pseudomonas californiensis]